MSARKLPLSILDYSRSVAGEPEIKLRNRYFESDPTNTDTQAGLISRPAMRRFKTMATAPSGRAIYSQPGTFGEALFCCAGDKVYKIAQDETVTEIGTIGTSTGAVSMAATETYLRIADGAALYSYTENDYARGTLTASGTIAAGDKVVLGSYTYKWATDVTPAADGSSSAPWLLLLQGTTADNLNRLYAAVRNSGAAGTDYSIAMIANPDVWASFVDATTVKVRATNAGTGGNSFATTETGANLAFGAATLAGGGGTSFHTIDVPDNAGVISVGVTISFTICLIAQGFGKNGRFYWIWPGEDEIADLDFATAERSPDPAWNIVPVGDHFLIPGWDSTEDWYPTGDGDAPFERQQGHFYDQGIFPGSVVKMDDDTMFICPDGRVVRFTAEGPQFVSSPGIAERLRVYINSQRALAAAAARVSLDFKNGVYAIGGTSKTLADVVEENVSYGAYSSSDVVAGEGLKVTNVGAGSTTSSPVLTAAALAAVIAAGVDAGFTAVATMSIDPTASADAGVGVELVASDLSTGWGFQASWAAGSDLSDLYDYAGPINDPVSIGSTGPHKIAFTLSASRLAACVGGGAVVTTGAPVANLGELLGIYLSAGTDNGSATLEKIEFFATAADGTLPGLSA